MASEPEATPAGEGGQRPKNDRRNSAAFLVAVVLAAAVVLVLGATAFARSQVAAFPADDSADAGFARDMADHHAQAVQMALVMVGRTEDPAIRILATDVLLTQQAQVGMMRGWLDVWGLPQSSLGRRMAWMGHAVEGPMPGMATDEEVDGLRELPPADADRRFLELMIRHHEGGLGMAQAGLDLGQQPVVRQLARAILASQSSEIETMQAMLARLPAGGGNEAGG
jgi:uncharacterized protein (DUF305 family)